METTLDFKSLSLLLGVVAALNASFLWAVKVMLTRDREHIDTKFSDFVKHIDQRLRGTTEKIDHEVARLRQEIDERYLRREEAAIREVKLDRKIDRLYHALDRLNDSLELKRLRSEIDDDDDDEPAAGATTKGKV